MSFSFDVSVLAAIPNLDTLESTVADWLDRDDLDAQIPVFIQLFEAEANRELRTPDMETSVLFSDEDEDRPLPADYLAMRAIYVEGSPDRPLRGISPTAQRLEFDGTAGNPMAYCLVAGGIRLVPPPADELLLRMDYFARIEPLTVVAPSNWLLEKHPDAYLYGTLYYAEAYLDNVQRASIWRQMLDTVFAKINHSTRNDRFGAGPLIPNATRQVRGARN